MRVLVCFIYFCVSLVTLAQKKVSFLASDGLLVTADLYLTNKSLPFILLFHQTDASRGEYLEIAPKLQNLNYNCLAVDLRSGSKMNYVINETAKRARERNLSVTHYDAVKDMEAAIRYIREYNHQGIVLFGSSYSASLSLYLASKHSNVEAVVAFSPGEYFRPALILEDHLGNILQPVFVTSTKLEYNYVFNLVKSIPEENLQIYKPKTKSLHGAKALWKENAESEAYWLELLLFFKR